MIADICDIDCTHVVGCHVAVDCEISAHCMVVGEVVVHCKVIGHVAFHCAIVAHGGVIPHLFILRFHFELHPRDINIYETNETEIY